MYLLSLQELHARYNYHADLVSQRLYPSFTEAKNAANDRIAYLRAIYHEEPCTEGIRLDMEGGWGEYEVAGKVVLRIRVIVVKRG